MFRVVAVCLLAAGVAIGCASTASSEYCLTGGGGYCSSLEGSGDCQPCPEVEGEGR